MHGTDSIDQVASACCTQCSKTYASSTLFDIHKYIHAIEDKKSYQTTRTKQFICNFCKLKCSTLEKIRNHTKSHRETCKKCNETFANGFTLGLHMSEHNPENQMCCPYCSYKTELFHCLRTHLFNKHLQTKIYRCETCGMTYCMKLHLEEHIQFHHKKMDPHQCVVCARKFIFQSSLKKHQVNKHRPLIDGDVPSNYCILCKRTLSTVQALQMHINERHANKMKPKSAERFICEICGNDFSHRQSWLLHIKGHSGLKPYKCKVCSKAFKVQAFLTVHEKNHSDEKPFACENCGVCFKRKSGLRRHLLIHTNIKPFVCTNCLKAFRRKEHLALHLKCCNKNRNTIQIPNSLTCDYCAKVCLRRNSLTAHLKRIHKIEVEKKIYSCDICSRVLRSRQGLLNHRNRHLKQYSIYCKVCGKGFFQPANYKLHLNSKHEGKTEFICNVCNRRCYDKTSLRNHLEKHTPEYRRKSKIICDECGSEFLCDRYLKIHKNKKHTVDDRFVCDMCGKRLYSKITLQDHMNVHMGLKPHKCEICGTGFANPVTLRLHVRRHTGEKPYKCSQCDKAFTQSHTLKIHYARIHTGSTVAKPFICNICKRAFGSRSSLTSHLRSNHQIIEITSDF